MSVQVIWKVIMCCALGTMPLSLLHMLRRYGQLLSWLVPNLHCCQDGIWYSTINTPACRICVCLQGTDTSGLAHSYVVCATAATLVGMITHASIMHQHQI